MNDVQNQTRSPSPPAPTRSRSVISKIFGAYGLLWMLAFTVMATLLRWLTDGLLADASPYSFYYLSVVLTSLVARMGSAMMAVILGGLCAHFFWVEPRFKMDFLNTSQIAQLVVFVLVATSCALAVTAARVLRIFDYISTDDD